MFYPKVYIIPRYRKNITENYKLSFKNNIALQNTSIHGNVSTLSLTENVSICYGKSLLLTLYFFLTRTSLEQVANVKILERCAVCRCRNRKY